MENQDNKPTLVIDDTVYETELTKKFAGRKQWMKPDTNIVTAYIPGVIQKIYVQKGQRVKWGDSLLILEAMKMKNDVTAHKDAVVKEVHVQTGQMVAKNEVLITLE
jgi:biotin carboxyl carrier protein